MVSLFQKYNRSFDIFMYLCSTDVRFLHLFLPGTQHLTPDYPKPLPFRQTVQDLMSQASLTLLHLAEVASGDEVSTEISGRMLDSGSL